MALLNDLNPVAAIVASNETVALEVPEAARRFNWSAEKQLGHVQMLIA
ncbi:hypothetical protein P0D73_19765 [Paraburkholderia sp. RL18-101-BIB-B]